MNVKLLTSPEHFKDMENNAAIATLTCHANTERDYVPHEVLGRIINAGHESILEHITLTYSVKGLSRACLQELARHRHISLSVESTRHTLHKYMAMPDDKITAFFTEYTDTLPIDQELVPVCCGEMLGVLKGAYDGKPDISNDELKYYLPEFWPTNLIMTANIRALRNIIKLRTAPAALTEFRVLAYSLYEAVPEEFRYLLADCVYKEEKIPLAIIESRPNAQANARLIASAPDMYKLLCEFLRIDEQKVCASTEKNDPAYMMALVAQDGAVKMTKKLIARIEGKEITNE